MIKINVKYSPFKKVLAVVMSLVLVFSIAMPGFAAYGDGIAVELGNGATATSTDLPIIEMQTATPAALTIVPMAGIQPFNAPPTVTIPDRNINLNTLSAGDSGNGWHHLSGAPQLSITSDGVFRIEGSAVPPSGLDIIVDDGVNADIVFYNVTIQSNNPDAAFTLSGSIGDVTIWIEGNNTFEGQGVSAGIFLANRNLTINGTGSLEVIGSTWGGIEGFGGSSLTVNGGTVNVTATGGANGIVVPSVTITGGAVTDNGSPVPRTHSIVTFDLHGGAGNAPQQVIAIGGTATRPATNPTRSGFVFVDWYTAAAGGTAFNFDASINDPTEIHARWLEQITDVAINITAPAYGGTPATATTATAQHTGTVAWYNNTTNNPAGASFIAFPHETNGILW